MPLQVHCLASNIAVTPSSAVRRTQHFCHWLHPTLVTFSSHLCGKARTIRCIPQCLTRGLLQHQASLDLRDSPARSRRPLGWQSSCARKDRVVLSALLTAARSFYGHVVVSKAVYPLAAAAWRDDCCGNMFKMVRKALLDERRRTVSWTEPLC
jgi:hypothetical protein